MKNKEVILSKYLQSHVNKFDSELEREGMPLNKTKMTYFEKEDILHLAISDEPEGGSLELSPNITVELNDNGELIGIEILNASTFIRDSILESVQAKMLSLAKVQTA